MPTPNPAGELLRAVVQAYDAATHTATVYAPDYTGAPLVGVPVADDVPPPLMAPGAPCLLGLYPDGHAVVVAPYTGAPYNLATGYCWDGGPRTFTSTSYVTYPGSTTTITLPRRAYLLMHGVFNAYGNSARAQALAYRFSVDGVQYAPSVPAQSSPASYWMALPICDMAGPLVAGPHQVGVDLRVMTAGDTITARYLVYWAMAVPV
ncbi:MAG: hypothetical protein V1772_09460 [Chloroflexota bacterium]